MTLALPTGCFPLLLSDSGRLVRLGVLTLNSSRLSRQFLRCVTRRTLSWHPALPAQHLMVGYAIPLAQLVAEFTGCAARSEGRNGTFAPLTTAEHSPALKRIPQPAALSMLQPHFFSSRSKTRTAVLLDDLR